MRSWKGVLAILYYLFCLSQNLRAAAINLGMQALPGSLSAKTQSAFFRKQQYLRKFFSCPEENLILSLVLFRQRSPRYRMTTDGAKNVAVCSFTIYFRITPLVLPRLSRVLLVFDCSQCKNGNLWAKTAYEKSSYWTNIFRIWKKHAKISQIRRIYMRFLLGHIITS